MIFSLNCSIKINRKNEINIAFLIIFDKARCFCIHKIQSYLFFINHTKCIDQKLRIKSNQQIFYSLLITISSFIEPICDLIFNSITSSPMLMIIGFLSPSFTRSVARSIQLNNSFLLIFTFVS